MLLGKGIRFGIPNGGRIDLGDRCVIERYCDLGGAGHRHIEARSLIASGSIISAASRVAIVKDALIAAYSMQHAQMRATGSFQKIARQVKEHSLPRTSSDAVREGLKDVVPSGGPRTRSKSA